MHPLRKSLNTFSVAGKQEPRQQQQTLESIDSEQQINDDKSKEMRRTKEADANNRNPYSSPDIQSNIKYFSPLFFFIQILESTLNVVKVLI